MTTESAYDLLGQLKASSVHRCVTEHSFFTRVTRSPLSRADVCAFVSQYWYPIHQFPSFLARVIARAPTTQDQTVISRILWQELGEGDPAASHEQLYIDTMVGAGLERSELIDVPMAPETRALVEGYQRAGEDYRTGIGWLYGTEVIDLPIVVGLGKAVRQVGGTRDLPWVSVHAKQEPSHVSNAGDVVSHRHSEADRRLILAAAEESWSIWASFFTELERGVAARASG